MKKANSMAIFALALIAALPGGAREQKPDPIAARLDFVDKLVTAAKAPVPAAQ